MREPGSDEVTVSRNGADFGVLGFHVGSSRGGDRGLYIEDVLSAVIDRLNEHYNRLPCEETLWALNHLADARTWLETRESTRRAQGVLGTMKFHDTQSGK